MCDLPQIGTFSGKSGYVTVVSSLHNLIMSDLKLKNRKNKIFTPGSDSREMVKETKQIWGTVKGS